MKIGFMGLGFVGGTTAEAMGKMHQTRLYDKFKEPYTNLEVLEDAEAVFIAVPTPTQEDGGIDLSIVHEALRALKTVNPSCLVIIRSTVVPGTADFLEREHGFRVASNPEFLREKHAKEDMENTQRVVIGASNSEDSLMVKRIYAELFPNAKYIEVNRTTAEMIKYASNVMLAGQIALANEIYHICNTLGAEYDCVKDALLLDSRIARNINVPGPDGDLGFGGKCFAKDLNALIHASKEKGYNPELFEDVWKFNTKIRKNKDWLEIEGAFSPSKKTKPL